MAEKPHDGRQLRESLSHSGFFVLRTPLLPIEELLSWAGGLEAARHWEARADADALEKAWATDVRLLRIRLRAILERPEILQALYVASPALQPGIEHWMRDPDSKKGLQAERSIGRYFMRMCARSTPFGLFSGCSTGLIGGEDHATALDLEPRSRYRTSSRLDFDYLFALTAALRHDAALALELRYWPNLSLRRIAGAWHYTECRLDGSKRSHHLVKLEDDRHLSAALGRAETGATVAELVHTVASQDPDDPPLEDEAREFVLDLVHNDVLVPSLSPLVTGEPPLEDLIHQLESLPSAGPAGRTLRRTQETLAELDRKGLGASPAAYEAAATDLKSLPAEVDIAKLYQVDMVKPMADGRLGTAVMDELVRGTEILLRIGRVGEPDELRSFREAFSQRYELAMVPLLEALDEETGLSFGPTPADVSPLLRGMQLVGGGDARVGTSPDWQTVLFRKVVQCAGEMKGELELDAADLPSAAGRTLPQAFCLVATLVASSTAAIQEGNFQLLFRGGFGPSGARMFGRFCHADPELERHVREHLRQEEAHDPDAVYAEVVYVPEGRLGNVLCRPLLRDYDIPCLGRSGAPRDRQIPVTDLLIGVEGGRIVLRSRRLGRRVVPRLTNAHSFMNPRLPAAYRLLCCLQDQGGNPVPAFSWGALEALESLPRLRVGRLVLSLARWNLSKVDLQALTQPSRKSGFLAMQELRHRRGLPRWVLHYESDNALPTDLDNPLSVDALAHVLRRVPAATLTEMYPGPEGLCVTSEEGRFCHELNVPMVLRPHVPTSDEQNPRCGSDPVPAPVSRDTRFLPTGSDWLYVKIYGGPVVLDEVLTSALPPLLEAVAASGASSRWFFVRYADPHNHLRIRFNGQASRLQRDVLPLVSRAFNPLLSSGRVWKIQFDTYDREIERYGGPEAAIAAEDIFFSDSEAVLAILRGSTGDEGLDLRWRAALWGLDKLLSDFGFDLETKRKAVGRRRADFEREQSVGARGRQQLGERFRSERRRLEALLWSSREPDEELGFARSALERRSAGLAGAVGCLKSLAAAGRMTVEITDLASSFAHMHVNRMVRSDAPTHELVLYDFLCRLYDAEIARTRRAGERAVATSEG